MQKIACDGEIQLQDPQNEGLRRESESGGNLKFSQNPVLDYYHSTTRGVQPHNLRTPTESGIFDCVSTTRHYTCITKQVLANYSGTTRLLALSLALLELQKSHLIQPLGSGGLSTMRYPPITSGRWQMASLGRTGKRRESKFVCGEKFSRARATETDIGNFLRRYCQLEGWDRVLRVGSSGHSGNGSFVH